MSQDAHMVEQVIKYSDGTETVIKYRGVIADGVLQTEKVEESIPVEADESLDEEAVDDLISEEEEVPESEVDEPAAV